MFDISFSELLLIGIVALIVIGPERLPKVARTVGLLLGRAQRYVNDVKSDIQREMDNEALSSLKSQMDEAAKSVKSSLEEAGNTLRNPLEEAQAALRKPLDDAQDALRNASESFKTGATAAPEASGGSNAPAEAPAPDTQTLPLPGFEDTPTQPRPTTNSSTETRP